MRQQSFEILDGRVAAEREKWIQIWSSWPDREVFAHPDYVRLFAAPGQSVLCAIAQSEKGAVLYPFLYRPLQELFGDDCKEHPWADISSAYGYSGPFYWGEGIRADLFWANFDCWAQSRSVVSEVIRFSMFEEALLPYSGAKQPMAGNIVRDLTPTESELLADFEHKVRKNIRRAGQQGVVIEVDESGSRLDEFLAIYTATMQRRGATAGYFFPKSFFEAIRQDLSGQFAYFFAMRNEEVISAELILVSESRIYSFLGGTLESAFEYRPNDLLKVEIMRWGKQRGKRHFVLGGGYTPEDGIYRYKQSFAPNGRMEFCIGARVLHPQRYEQLIEARRKQARSAGVEWSPKPNFFPEYRA